VEGGFTPGFTPQPVGQNLPKLRPLKLGDVIGGAFEIYSKSAVQMWQIVALVVIPITILEVVLRRVSIPSDASLLHGNFTHPNGSTSSISAVQYVVFPLNIIGGWLAAGALFHVQLDTYLGRAHSAADSLAYFGHRALQLIWLGVLVFITVVVGFIALVIPGIWLSISLAVAFPVLMLEGKTGPAAITRSIDVVRGFWWVTFGRLIVAYLIAGVWTGIVLAIGGGIANSVTNITVYEIIIGIANAIGFILVYPFTSAVINLIYLDLRVRKEGISDADFLERPRDPAYTVEAQAPPAEQAGMPSPPPDDPPPGDEPPPGGSVTRY
jgi:hypothetical protein